MSTIYALSNEHICIEVSSFGAELKSLKRQSDSREYMWDARPEFWKRTSPVLFPIVGSLHEGQYHYEGQSFAMSQHGFARDMELHWYSRRQIPLPLYWKITQRLLQSTLSISA